MCGKRSCLVIVESISLERGGGVDIGKELGLQGVGANVCLSDDSRAAVAALFRFDLIG
jgi:hypothetical protein